MKRAAVLSLTDPYAKRDGGTLRTRAIIESIAVSGFDVTCVHPVGDAGLRNEGKRSTGRLASARAATGEVKRRLLPLPTELGQRSTRLGARVSGIDPDVTVASILSQAQFVDPDRTTFWLDFMDIWSDVGRRESVQRFGPAKLTSLAQSRWLATREDKYCASAHIVTAAGWSDWKSLIERGHTDAVWLPTPIADSEFETVPRIGVGGKVAGLLGNFNYWPNLHAYRTVLDHWLPALIDCGWRVVVAGMGSEALEPRSGVTAMGMVDDLNDYYGLIDATLAPIDLGGGMKVKVLESFSRGVPVIGTEFAFDGFPDHIRDLGITVGLTSPDLAGLASVTRLDPSTPELNEFSASSFRRKVEDILNTVG
jgi:hypothetical protein